MNRRSFIQVGGIGSLGLTIGDYNILKASNNIDDNAKAKSVIYIYMPGGFAAQETFDPKPLAPTEYRGSLNAIDTKITGVKFSQYLPKTASIADKIAVIRSMTHGETAHERGRHDMFTGYKPSAALTYPSFGSITSQQLGVRNNLPPYIAIPSIADEYAGTGYLSHSYSPFTLGSNPESDNFKVRDLQLPDGVSRERFETRKRILNIVNNSNFVRTNSGNDNLMAVEEFYDNAFAMIDSKSSTEAFDLGKEDDKMKERYGRNAAGMRMLLARRLVEAGSRFITVTYSQWDMHQNIESGIKNNLPPFDQAYSALINDLDEKGMLDSTLVVVATEFGRTPKINTDGGRDHWPKVFSVLMAGGGIKRGIAYGQSDQTATDVFENPVKIEDFGATIYELLGIDYTGHLYAPGDRPVKIIDGGKPVKGIIA
jgi:hypothetical protein